MFRNGERTIRAGLLFVRAAAALLWLVLPAGAAGSAWAATAPGPAVPLPAGETLLGDIGAYQVGYQSYGGPEVRMPDSWMGHFEGVSGISYIPYSRILGRTAILLVPPWRVPTGKTWVDYRLSLPRATPITLSFGIGIAPDMAVPGRSDGVTFSCFLVDGERPRELMRQHHEKGEWRDYRFDLSRYAGLTLTLRLQTEPGPKNSPAFDYSYFGGAKVVCGRASQARAGLLKRLTSTRAFRATAKADLRALSNTPGNGVTPGNLLPCKTTVSKVGASYQLAYAGQDCRVVYTVEPITGTLDDLSVQVDNGRPFKPALGGGATAQSGKDDPVPLRGGKPVRVTARDRTLDVLWEYPLKGTPVRIAWTFAVQGKALRVSAKCDDPVVTRFSLGEVGQAPLRKMLDVPYLHGPVAYLPVQNVFVCRTLDWTVSHASACPQGEATYEPKTDGTRNPLVESGYVAVSPDVGEVLPNIPHPPSPYLGLLGPKIMLDVWAHHNGTYQGDGENLRALKDNGVDHLAIISHNWQRFGYDVKMPDHFPANPAYGGDEGMREFGRAAKECGYPWSLHEVYIGVYPDAPSYDPRDRVQNADGSPTLDYINPATRVQSFGLKCSRALDFARRNAPEIHQRYGTTATYLDVNPCVPPWHELDHEAGQPMAAMALYRVKHHTELFQFMRDAHAGPLFGEGAYHFYWAGRCDGVEAQVADGENHSPFLDFDLLKLHPQMVNHGMGYYERWFERGYSHHFGADTGTMEQIDKYRAQELAYGHAGYVGSAQTDSSQWVAREHHLMHAVQRLYGTARPSEIRYEVDGQWVPAGMALVLGNTTRQRIRYDSGLTLWVNWRPEVWHVNGRVLPQWGFLALGPSTEVCTTLRNGRFADYAECPEYVFADARTSFSMPYLKPGKDIEPRIRSLEYLGGGRARLTYEWIVSDTLERDNLCFVHFVNEASASSVGIEFQGDHALARPTSTWRKGETVVDGPHEIEVPATGFDTYDVVIGLHHAGDRVPLKGIQEGDDRFLVGRLKIEREGGQIRNIALANLGDAARKRQTPRADFSVRLNPAGTWVDFGKVATDGSVKINKDGRRLVLFPYPRDRQFRVGLDLRALAPHADLARVRVRVLAAGTRKDMGAGEFRVERGQLKLTVGTPGAGRYVVTW